MLGRVTCRVMLTTPHHVTVTLLLMLLLVVTGDVTSTQSRHDNRHWPPASVDFESSNDGLAQRDQPMVSQSEGRVAAAAAACQMPSWACAVSRALLQTMAVLF